MKERITLLVESGEVPKIKLLWYMLETSNVTVEIRMTALPTLARPLNHAVVT